MTELTDEAVNNFLGEWLYGEHRIAQRGKLIRHHPEVVEFRTPMDIDTFDNDDLTRLVILAHKHSIRVSIIPRSRMNISIMLHQRVPKNWTLQFRYEYHPGLEDLVETINRMRG